MDFEKGENMTRDQITVHFKLNAKQNLKTEGLCQAYLQGAEDCWDYIKENETDTYEKGLQDAWKVFAHVQSGELSFEEIRKVWDMDEVEFVNSFTEKYTPQEAIKKLKEYEEKHLAVGDVVILDDEKFIIIALSNNEMFGYSLDGKYSDFPVQDLTYSMNDVKKTGKHFDIVGMMKQIS